MKVHFWAQQLAVYQKFEKGFDSSFLKKGNIGFQDKSAIATE
jgi:hypothetical protein